MMQPFSSASMQMVREILLSMHTTRQPASISRAVSWLSMRLPTMTMSPLEMAFSICSGLPEPMMMLPSTRLPSTSPTTTVAPRVSMMF